MRNDTPEINTTPPDDGVYITAGCGHEVHASDEDDKGRPENFTIEWVGQTKIQTLCPECFRDKINEMSVEELAEHFNCNVTMVGG